VSWSGIGLNNRS